MAKTQGTSSSIAPRVWGIAPFAHDYFLSALRSPFFAGARMFLPLIDRFLLERRDCLV